MTLARAEVTERSEGRLRTTVIYFDPDVDEVTAAAVQPILDKAVAELVPVLGSTRLAREALFALLVQYCGDAEAYEREAARRGVLAL